MLAVANAGETLAMLPVEAFHPEGLFFFGRLASGRPPAFSEHLSPWGRLQAPTVDIETPPWAKEGVEAVANVWRIRVYGYLQLITLIQPLKKKGLGRWLFFWDGLVSVANCSLWGGCILHGFWDSVIWHPSAGKVIAKNLTQKKFNHNSSCRILIGS